jgi:large subunit ribosomal protein L10
MDNPRPEKVAVVDEVRERLDAAAASVVTEYRGLTVADLATLRRALTAVGGEYKVFKNTLVKRAIDGSAHAPLAELLTGPTAIAFVHGDVSAVAKALRDFSRTKTHLVIKGGILDGTVLSPAQLGALAELPSREVLLARLAGGFQAPLAQLAGLIQALPRNLAYGLKALIDQRGGAPADGAAAPADQSAAGSAAGSDEAAATEAAVTETAATEAAATEAAATETAATEAAVTETAATEGAEGEPPRAETLGSPSDAPAAETPVAETDEPAVGDE